MYCFLHSGVMLELSSLENLTISDWGERDTDENWQTLFLSQSFSHLLHHFSQIYRKEVSQIDREMGVTVYLYIAMLYEFSNTNFG